MPPPTSPAQGGGASLRRPAGSPPPPAPGAAAARGRHRPRHRRRGFDWRTAVRGLGRTLIALGLLILLFVAYQLWGTGIQTARAQSGLEAQFAERLAAASTVPTTAVPTAPPPTTSPVTTATGPPVYVVREGDSLSRIADLFGVTLDELTASSGLDRSDTLRVGQQVRLPAGVSVPGATPTAAGTTAPPITTPVGDVQLDVREGDPLARIEIPRIGVDWIVVAGVQLRDLRKGPGHYPDTPLPGQLGNAAIAGHRTTYGAPFFRVDELRPGDEINVTMPYGRFRYLVTGQQIISPTDFSVLAPSDEPTLTLTSCHPRYSDRQRIVIKAVMDRTASAPVTPATPGAYGDGEPAASPGTTVAPADDGTTATTVPVGSESLDELNRGWFSDSSAWTPTILYGLLCTLIFVAAWLLSHAWRRWLGYVVMAPLFLVALYFFFENFSRLLPPTI